MRMNPLTRLGRDTVYILLGFPLATVSFVVVVTGISLAAGLLVTLIGIPVVVATLGAARGFGGVERGRLRLLDPDRELAPRGPIIQRGRGLVGWLRPLRDGQAWLDLLHALINFPLATTTFSLVVSWFATALGGLTYWFWSRFLPENRAGDDNTSLAELLGWRPQDDVLLYLAIGAFALVTLWPLVRVCALLQSSLARVLVANDYIAGLHQRVDTLTATRAAVVQAEADTLRRLERDLHDGPQARLVRLQMDLASAERRLTDDPDAARSLVVGAQTQVDEALGELRNLSRGIAPPILVDRGLPPALAALAARATVDVRLDVRLPDGSRLPATVENTAYFVVAEALTNVAKHARATSCEVSVVTVAGNGEDAVVRIQVRDDGVGGASLAKGHGLAGLSDRLAAVDGTLGVHSPAGGPTVLTAEIPVR